MEALLAAAEWIAIVLGGLIIRAALVILMMAAIVAVLLPVLYAFEGGRRLLLRLRGIEHVHGFEWRRQPRYASTHLWLGERGRTVRIGLDSVAARLLARVEEIDLLPGGSRVSAGDPIATFVTRHGAVAVPAPVDGVVERVNARLGDRPDLPMQHPYGEGWLVDVKPATSDFRALPRANEARRWFSAEAVKLTFALEHASGYAAADGGEPTVPHHALLTGDDFARLATEFLNAKVTPLN
jgi:glycine cleavage system H protein